MRILTPYLRNRNVTFDLFSDVDQLFDQFYNSRGYDERKFNQSTQISETEEHYLMSVDLPGMKKEDIKIELKESFLTISGERKRSQEIFKQSFSLPSSVDAEKVEAHYEDGVLELYLPKVKAAQPRQIEIQSGKTGSFFDKLLCSKKESKETSPPQAS